MSKNKLTGNVNKQQYEFLKCDLDEIYDKFAKGIRVRRRFQHYKQRKKTSKYFLKIKNLLKIAASFHH